MTTIKHISPLSLGKIQGIIGILAGLFAGLLGYFGGKLPVAVSDANQADAAAREFSNALGIGIIIFLPIIYGVIGFIAGAIGAAIYNVTAKLVGGINIKLEEKE